ncbi:Quinone oxidoreductase-like protein 2-like protein [Frankliniella fusca]|uniref:Quinone oxidoreductase-like protein 2-like protein n=1 Tax=Frankliniella fusca TaxID=407009 RepID=A0AAE1LFP3_9NEOP|nr:Quinone oxidoreductase-like protein 2-like protein [Frankliniella fusca]KAK3917973.1 Quinone oxidoreductase-like protein 2-like protein [Frankliniella fusca]
MAVPLSKQIYSIVRKTVISREVPSRLGPLGGFFNGNIRNASTYKAAVLKEFRKPLEIENVSAPKKIQKDEIRVKVVNCAVNASDIMICDGEAESSLKLPFTPGFEIAGEILECGSEAAAEGFNVGDRIVGLNKDNHGGFAEQCVISMKDAWQAPSSVSYKKCVSLADSYATALIGLARRAHLKEGDSVLITAAAGGLGLAAVDIASHVYRAKVVGVCSTSDKSSLVREKGAWAALVFNPHDLEVTVKDVSKGKGMKVVFDAVGGDVFTASLKTVAHEGTVIVAGFASRQVPQLLLSELLQGSYSILGVSLSYYRSKDPEVYRDTVQDVLDMCEQGLISPHISQDFDLENVNEAMEYMRARKSSGKVIINLCDS